MSKIEVNQISSQCGSTLTIGQSGDTVTLACGATQTGFGRTGTVDWDTTAKTASFTAVSGNGYFVNTTSGAITLTLPASPSAGDIVSFKDYAYTFATNNLTVDGNSSNIGGENIDNVVYSTNGTSKTFIYVDGTKGWLVTNESTDTSSGLNPLYVTATGGTITCCGDYKIHTFTSPGTFTVTCAGNSGGSNVVDYMVVAGGAGGGGGRGGGGGAGGFRESKATGAPWIASPLATCASLPVTVTGYPVTIGAGGSGGAGGCTRARGAPGSNSIFSTITSAGGGGAGSEGTAPGIDGGSGGGSALGTVGAGNTPPVSPPQGQDGSAGSGPTASGGGGGGATTVGVVDSRDGGAGATTSISGSSTAYAGGGGGAGNCIPGGTGGAGGGANGAPPGEDPAPSASANTGGGGGGGRGTVNRGTGGSGGSGIVIIRYKYQN
jgi:hypothetical protein